MDIFRLYGHDMTKTPESSPPKVSVLVRFEQDENDRLMTVAKAEKLPRTILIRRIVDEFCKALIKEKGLVSSSAKTEEPKSDDVDGRANRDPKETLE